MAADEIDHLLQDLDRVRENLRDLAAELREAAAVAQEGRLPDEALAARFATCITECKTDMANAIDALRSTDPNVSDRPSIDDLILRLTGLRQRLDDGLMDRALELLSRAQRVAHARIPDFEPVLRVRARAAELHAELLRRDPVALEIAAAIAAGSHPIAQLLHLIEPDAGPAGDGAEERMASVLRTFGPELGAGIYARSLQIVEPAEVLEPPAAPAANPEMESPDRSRDATAEALPPLGQAAPTPSPEAEAAPEPESESESEPAGPASAPDTEGTPPRLGPRDLPAQAPKGSLRSPEHPDASAGDLWSLLAQGDPAIAAHLASALGSNPELPSPAILRALALSAHLTGPHGEIAEALRHQYQEFPPDEAERFPLLVWSATLVESLLAPETGSVDLLRGAHLQSCPHLSALTAAVLEKAQLLHGLTLDQLLGVQAQVSRRGRIDGAQSQVAQWLAAAPQMTFLYQPATVVWREWLKPQGVLTRLLEPVARGDEAQRDAVQQGLRQFADQAEVRTLVRSTDRRVRSRNASEIHARALNQLTEHLGEAVRLVQAWLAALDQREHSPEFILRHLDALRTDVLGHYGPAMEEISAIAGQGPSAAAQAAMARSALGQLGALLEGRLAARRARDVHHILSERLLFSPEIELDADWMPTERGEALARQIARIAAEPQDQRASFEQRLERRDLEAAGRILECLRSSGDERAEIWQAEYQNSLRENREALHRVIQERWRLLLSSVAFVTVEDRRSELEGRLKALEAELEHNRIRRFDLALRDLDELEADVRGAVEQRLEDLRGQLGEIQGTIAAEDLARITQVIARGDLLSAEEYLQRVLAGERIQAAQPNRNETLEHFFPGGMARIESELHHTGIQGQLAQRVGSQRDFAGLSFSAIPGAQAKEAAQMLRDWLTMKRDGKVHKEELRHVMSALGFAVREIRFSSATDNVQEIELDADPIADPEICPVPAYGSAARGLYRVVAVWHRPSEDSVLNRVWETAALQRATIVLYFGQLTEKRRRDMALRCRETLRTFILLDDTLLIYLTAQRGLRLPHLFRASLPFAFTDPYTSITGEVPPEMFYGRRQDLRNLVDAASSSCFVYGGRQLGKTALLRHALWLFHRPEEKRYGFYLDLRSELGSDGGPDGIWPVLARVLAQAGIPLRPQEPNSEERVQRLIHAIESWMADDPERRVLLLLDEADRFLEQDMAREFRESRRLRQLMENTGRRFKIVLAGLHNVLRTVQQANHPLAQFGDPIRVGPMLHNGEWLDARALIEVPFLTIGYRFESDDLVTRILAQTNYYPSLVQLFCRQLLRNLTGRRVGSSAWRSAGPPFTITEQHVEEAFRSRELREMIRQRFQLTLQLDQRYEVIAYYIAFAGQEPDGLEVPEIRAGVQEFWPDGFAQTTDHEFDILLDEMLGLGVLRLSHGRYFLRSHNVLLLMGTSREVEDTLLKTREPRIPYEPGAFRPPLDGSGRCSPITSAQEAVVRGQGPERSQPRSGVVVIYGTRAGGIDDVAEALEKRRGGGDVRVLQGITGSSDFRKQIGPLPSGSGPVTFLVPNLATEQWIEQAIFRAQKSRDRVVRFVFLADPNLTWGLSQQAAFLRRSPAFDEISLSPWKPSFLRQWLEDAGIAGGGEARVRLQAVTGNWPVLLERIRPQLAEGALDAILAEFEQGMSAGGLRAEVGELLGLDVAEPRETLRQWLQLASGVGESEFPLEEIAAADEIHGIPPDRSARTLWWAERLQLVTRVGNRCRFDPVLARVLQ